MADIVNLRQARKAKARSEKDELAAANRVKFGRSKGEKQLTAAKSELETRRLDGHRLGGVDGQRLGSSDVTPVATLAATSSQGDSSTSNQTTAPEATAPSPTSHG